MLYNQPLDQPANPNAPYVDGNPAAGIQGSIVPAASLEYDQREVVEVITRANSRGYIDFSDTPCAPPANIDLMQLRKAIEGFIRGWDFIIDTVVTKIVHGPGADFPDLIAAMAWLRRYYITQRGQVIFRVAAGQWTYTQTIIFRHPNNDRISVFGATMKAACPRQDTAYASRGPSAPTRSADVATNLAMLRSKFATEIYGHSIPGSAQQASAIVQIGPGNALMHWDGILLTGDLASVGIEFYACQGPMNLDTYSGIAIVQCSYGIYLSLGSAIQIWGSASWDENVMCPVVCIGSGSHGMALGDGSHFTMLGNFISLNGNGNGLNLWPNTGVQLDGACHSQSNSGHGIYLDLSPACYVSGPLSGGSPYTSSHIWNNGGWGILAFGSTAEAYVDCGAGMATANGTGSIALSWASNIHCTAGDQHISGSCTPPFGVWGNYDSMIF
jgi:hypothetical protein